MTVLDTALKVVREYEIFSILWLKATHIKLVVMEL